MKSFFLHLFLSVYAWDRWRGVKEPGWAIRYAVYPFQFQLFRLLPLRLFMLLLNLIEIKIRLTFMKSLYCMFGMWWVGLCQKVEVGQGPSERVPVLGLSCQRVKFNRIFIFM